MIGLPLDQGGAGALDVGGGRRVGERRPSPAERRVRSVRLAEVLDLRRDGLPLPGVVAKQRFDLGLLLHERVVLLAELHLLKPSQAAQPGVEHVVHLHIRQREFGHQDVLWFVLLADDADHLVEVEEHDEHAGQHFQPMLDLPQSMT